MDAAVATAGISKTFPFGAIVVDEGMDLTYPIINLQVEAVDGVPTLLGWGLPNKDFYYDLSNAEIRDDGWLVTRAGARCLLKPQDKADEAKIRRTMELMD